MLSRLGYDADTVIEEGLAAENDDAVWRAAQQAGRLLVTQDLDFSDIRKFQPGTHCGSDYTMHRNNLVPAAPSSNHERIRVLAVG